MPSRLADIPRDRAVLLICRNGNRPDSPKGKLQQLGYPQVFNFAGGMNASASAGQPVSR